MLKNKKIKNQNQEKIIAQAQDKAGIIKTKFPKLVSQGKTEELTYAKTIETSTQAAVSNKQQASQVTDYSVERMLRQILNNQELIEKRFVKLENTVKTLVNKKNG